MINSEVNKQLEINFLDKNPESDQYKGLEIYAKIDDSFEKPKEQYFRELLIDRENAFEINLELEIKRILEFDMDYHNELQKNDNKYNYDLKVFKYYINGADYDKKLIAFIEIEVSENWKNDYPKNWKNDSFLARKVLQYDYKSEEFMLTNLKENADDTVYIIFNKSLTDSVCCDMVTISKFKLTYIPLTDNPYNNGFLRESLLDCNKKVIRGIDNCRNYIEEFIKTRR